MKKLSHPRLLSKIKNGSWIFLFAQLLFLCSLYGENKFLCSIGKKPNGYYSQYDQDRFVYETFFKEKKTGVFVDIGAHNGIALSNTKFFEEIGWSGLCIEPIPEVFQELQKNRTCACVQGCISNREGKVSFLRIDGYHEMLSGIFDNYSKEHLQRIQQSLGILEHESHAAFIETNCYLLNNLLEEREIYQVDFLSLDTEGGELEILKSLDYSRFQIEIIDVENNYHDPEFRTFLKSKGYNLVKELGCDEIYQLEPGLKAP